MPVKISELTELTAPANGDLLAIVDIAANTTKKVTKANLLKSGINNGIISNPYKFSVYRNGAWATGANVFARVNFDTKEYDTGTNYSTSTFRFVAPMAGFYKFSSSVTSQAINNGATIAVAIYKNGAEVKRLTQQDQIYRATGSSTTTLGGSTTLSLAATDYVEVWYLGNGTTGTVGPALTWFQGEMISAT